VPYLTYVHSHEGIQSWEKALGTWKPLQPWFRDDINLSVEGLPLWGTDGVLLLTCHDTKIASLILIRLESLRTLKWRGKMYCFDR
jgi:hypothetical protein